MCQQNFSQLKSNRSLKLQQHCVVSHKTRHTECGPNPAVRTNWSHDGDSLRWNVGSWSHRLQALALIQITVQSFSDLVELVGHAGEQHYYLSQYDAHRQSQGDHKAGGQVEAVGLLLKGPFPAKQQTMEGGYQEGNVAQSRLEGDRGDKFRKKYSICNNGSVKCVFVFQLLAHKVTGIFTLWIMSLQNDINKMAAYKTYNGSQISFSVISKNMIILKENERDLWLLNPMI